LPAWQRLGLEIFGRLPQSWGRTAVQRAQALSGLDPSHLEGLTSERLAAERLRDYPTNQSRYANITLGAPLGGAAAHLALLLEGPFLPGTFVTTLRGGARHGSVDEFLANSRSLARRICDANPDLLAIQHFDPVHDGWLTQNLNHLRFKLLDLPNAYTQFIDARLEPGGTVVYLDCGATWLRYRLGERQYLQVGGWGDISPEEYLEGSPRLEVFSRRTGLHQSAWKLADHETEYGPESEWGSEPGLEAALAEYCRMRSARLIHIRLPHPHDFSTLAFEATRLALAKDGREPAGMMIEMFSQFEVWAVMRSGLLPLWLVFNTRDSLAYLKHMRAAFPTGKPVFFSPLATFSITPDLVPFGEWEDALAGTDWHLAGARPSHYPADTWAVLHWRDKVGAWAAENQHPIKSRFTGSELLALSQKIQTAAML
jgi:hypothetical protein